jgi:glycosyltransferase involved in cell wall biosynthesis
MRKILLISPYWKEPHRWMVSSVKLAELWQRLGYSVTVVCMGSETGVEKVSDTLTIHRRKDIFLPDPLNFGIAFGFAGYARRVINQEKPDIVVVNKVLFWTSFALIPLRLTGHRVLLLTDALVGMTWWPRGRIPKIIMGIGAWTMGWLVLLCANRIVTFHPQPENLLKRLGIWKKTQVIPTGIDPEPFGKEVESGKLDEVESGKCPPAGRAGKVPACRTGRESGKF